MFTPLAQLFYSLLFNPNLLKETTDFQLFPISEGDNERQQQ